MASKNTIKAVQINLGKSRNATHELLNYIHKNQTDLIFVQEPYTNNFNQIKKIPGYIIYQFPKNNNPLKSAIILKENSFSTLGLTQFSNSNLTIIRINTTTGQTIHLTSIYIRPRDDTFQIIQAIDNFISNTRNSAHIICGDFNAWHTAWGSIKNNHRGNTIMNLMLNYDLILRNIGNKPTFNTITHGAHRDSIIDLTITSNTNHFDINDWTVNTTICPSSDHNAITFNINLGKPQLTKLKKQSTYKYNTSPQIWKQAEEQFKKQLTLNLPPTPNIDSLNEPDLESYINQLTQSIQITCNKTLPRSCKPPPKAPWWNDELENIKKKVIGNHHKLRKLKQRKLPLDEAIRECTSARQAYSEAISKASNEHFKEFCTTQSNEDVWTITNRIIKTRPPAQPPSTLKKEDGTYTKNSTDTAQALINKFYPDDLIQTDTPHHSYIRSLVYNPILNPDEPPFTSCEVINVIKNMNPKKAPGPDHLTADICFQAILTIPEIFCSIMNRCLNLNYFPKIWKVSVAKIIPKSTISDHTELSHFRPIGLINVFGKLLEKLITNRLTHHLYKTNNNNTKQFGFKLQTSTTHAITSALNHVYSAKKQHQHTIIASLDIKAAFDHAWWPAIHKRLQEIDCPNNLYYLLQSYLNDRTVKINFADQSINKTTTRGCVQGSVCGPLLWNLILDELLEIDLPKECQIQAYADDVLLICSSKCTKTLEESTNSALEIISEWGKSVKLEFGPTKTKIIAFSNQALNCKIHTNGTQLNFTDHIKYLGVIIDRQLKFIKHTDYIIEKAKNLFHKLAMYIKPTWGIHPGNITIIYNQVIQPIICYAASVWSNALQFKYVQKRLLSLQRIFAIKIIHGFRTISTTASISIAQLTPLPTKILTIAEIETTRLTKTTKFLPSDIPIESCSPPESLLHPSKRIQISFNEVHSQTEIETNDCLYKIFTDGSKHNDSVGAAFVITHPTHKPLIKKFKLHRCCSVFQAELLAIQKALQHTITEKISPVTIFTDSLSGLLEISNPNSTNHLVNIIHHQIIDADKNKTKITFTKVPAHCGIAGNELADTAAKAAATLHKTPDYNKIPISHIKLLNAQHCHQYSAEFYLNTSPYIRNLLPTYPDLVAFLAKVKPSFSITQLLTNHGYHLEYLKRFNISDTDLCPCDNNTKQTTTHLLTVCPRFCKPRQEHISTCSHLHIDPFQPLEIIKKQATIDSFMLLQSNIIKNIKNFNKPP